jgi:predicted nucleic acid-binding protein
VRAYADSSFILRLVTREEGSELAIAEYRRLDFPALFFLPLHVLEVSNAILQRAFHQRRSIGSGKRQQIARERDAALGRLEQLAARRSLLETLVDMDTVTARATELSRRHTERLGTRAIDLLHVAAALVLEAEVFLTADERQSQLAKAEALEVVNVG